MPVLPPSAARRPLWLTVALAFIMYGSGVCALLYQTVWLREFRMVFGGAAPAAAAVLAVFMAGLGFGGWWFGRRVESVRFPFRFYARLEVAIAIAAMLTPKLLELARALYLATGGLQTLGDTMATLVQIGITALVLGVPCFLMGGTLPAAMKFAQRDDDPNRSSTALFYAINVVGAVSGAALGTFWMLGTVGNQGTLGLAAMANALIGGLAWIISRRVELKAEAKDELKLELPTTVGRSERAVPKSFVLTAAFVSGFTFFVVELLWYRVSASLLGGSVYGFGLVLCVALAGMGLGGLLYSLLLKTLKPSVGAFMLVSALQAVCVIAPWVIGDNYAFGALVVNETTRGFGFGPVVAGWATIIAGLAFLPSLLAGVQFPLLVSLLGRGNAGVGRELGQAYLCNTSGAIAGSLMGGFVLVPALGLNHTWLLVAGLIGLMPVAALLVCKASQAARTTSLGLIGAGVAAVVLAQGPTAVWYHYPIGYGRSSQVPDNSEKLEAWKRTIRRSHLASFDGRETSVAVTRGDQLIILTNGKADGSSLVDASTQVMLGLVGAALHEQPKTACVIGLATGTTAGWLAEAPGMERVDAIELEAGMLKLAEIFKPVNHGAMQNPKINHIIGDARELLMAKGKSYDLIISEPSNPYRAGVASLYTREFYKSVHDRLNADGILCQWVQGYEASPETIDTVINTLASEFPKVEIWNTQDDDLLLVASKSTKPWNTAIVQAKLRREPYATALRRLWFTDSVEGFMARCVANQDFTRSLTTQELPMNTDNLNLLEFGFARTLGKHYAGAASALRKRAYKQGQMMPKLAEGALDPNLFTREALNAGWRNNNKAILCPPVKTEELPQDTLKVVAAFDSLATGNYAGFIQFFGDITPITLQERWMLAVAHSLTGDPAAGQLLTELDSYYPENVSLLRVRQLHALKNLPEARKAFAQAANMLKHSPWIEPALLQETLKLADDLTNDATPEEARMVFNALREPFLAMNGEESRLNALSIVAARLGNEERLAAVEAWGPHYPWQGLHLAIRAATYMAANDSRLIEAMADVETFTESGGELPVPKAKPLAKPVTTVQTH